MLAYVTHAYSKLALEFGVKFSCITNFYRLACVINVGTVPGSKRYVLYSKEACI